MCRPASFVIAKDYKVFWSRFTDSHSKIVEEHKLCESIHNQSVATMKILLAKVEVIPPNDNMKAPLKDWIFVDTDDQQPEWYDRAKAEKAARKALVEWHKQKVITVTPDHPLADGEFFIFDCTVEAMGNSTVKAMCNSTVKAMDNSTVEAMGNSTVKAWGNSTVKAMGNSTVKAMGNSTVKAMDNSTVEAWGNSTVKAWGNSTVEAWGNSTVKAWATPLLRQCATPPLRQWATPPSKVTRQIKM